MKDYSILIGAIDEVVSDYDKGILNYHWFDHAQCNCGLIAQKVMKISSDDLDNALFDEYDYLNKFVKKEYAHCTWSDFTKICSNTKLPMSFIVKTLLEAGFELNDFTYLENLSNPVIRKRAGLCKHNEKSCDSDECIAFIKYIKAWKDILIEKQLNANRQSFIELKNIIKPVNINSVE